jgi:hypothetical protein
MRTENDYTETDLGNISPNPRGEYDEKASYEYLDLISYQGGSYLCLAEPKTIVSGIAPKAGQNTEVWQMIALPGDLTSEYIAMHDDIVVKAKQAEASRLAAELAQQTTEAARADVQQLHADAVRATEEAENSRDTAGGYAAAAEQSRKAAKESEDNAHAQVTGFDSYVAEKTTQATQDIESARQTAVSAVTSQQDTSVQAVAAEGKKYIDAIKADAETVANDRQAVEEAAQTVVTQAQEVAQNTQTVATNTESAAKSAQSAQTSAENAAKSAEGVQDAVNQITTNTKDISDLKTDVQNAEDVLAGKISKFYATNNGENHLADSDNGKIQDMKVFGNSEQKKYNGYQLFALAPTNKSTGEKVSLPYTENGITVDIANDGIGYTVRGTNTLNEQVSDIYLSMSNAFDIEAGTYTRSGKIINGNNNVELISGGGISSGGCLEYKVNKENFTFTETVKKGKSGNFIIRISPSATVNAIVYFQIEKGSEAHAYEPYTGGQPSPSPDYPQVIKSVVNPTIKVRGKNLFDQAKVFKNIDIAVRDIIGLDCRNIVGRKSQRRYYLIECKPNTKYYMTFVNPTNNIFIGIADKNYIGMKNIAVFETFTRKIFTTSNDANFIVLNTDVTSDICLSTDDGNYEPYTEQSIQLPITINAIPVSSGGNVTINGQQYISDYVDVERGKLVRMVGVADQDTFEISKWESTGSIVIFSKISNVGTGDAIVTISSKFTADWSAGDEIHHFTQPTGQTLVMVLPKTITTVEQGEAIRAKGFKFYYILVTPIEIDLTEEENAALKELATYYPVTNISINSEQIDGYTIFNYPISMANGWNYVKQQLNDNRDYIYDMDSRTQDIDTQAAEAYVNSEYVVALTELEV